MRDDVSRDEGVDTAMRGRGAPSVLPKAVIGLCVAFAVATGVLLLLGVTETTPADEFGLAGVGGAAFAVASLAFGVTGALVASRVPGNPIGWILCAMGVLIGFGNLAYQYADYALFVEPGALPSGDVAAVAQNLGLTPCFGLLGLVLLLFPDGRLRSRRWRPAAGIALLGSGLVQFGYAFRPGPLDEPFENVMNPIGLGSTDLLESFVGLGWLLMTVSVALGAASMILRLRRSSGVEHEQLKWIAFAAAGIGVVFALNFLSFILEIEGIDSLRIVVLGLTFSAFPVAAGIAILRYRLYDIDVVINRTLVYGALTASLVAVYLASVLLLQLALGGVTEDSNLAIAGSTLAVAAVFRPARVRIQALVDRRFFRSRYDARQTLESFSTRLRDEIDLTALDAELRRVVAETMQPSHVSLWLRGTA